MPGKRGLEACDFVTNRRDYRLIDAVDADVDSVPVLDSRIPENGYTDVSQDRNQYGRNAQLNLACIMEGFTDVTLQLWLKAELETYTASSSSGSPVDEWVFVEEKVVDKSTLWIVKDVPPGQYRVVATAVTGSGEVTIREQHAA